MVCLDDFVEFIFSACKQYATRFECRSTNDLQHSIEKVSRDRNIEKWLQTTPEDWNNKSIKWIYGETF